jgi:predicted SAM-dependent methyltransferase
MKGELRQGHRLHIGCGMEAIPGWINIDNRPLPGVDRVLDVRRGLPFRDVSAIYAEHFLEHLTLKDGGAFLRECRRILAEEGTLRLSTPNLDWVYQTHYRVGLWTSEAEKVQDCLGLNRAFHGWGHRFLYYRETLRSILRSAGFSTIEFYGYGESAVPTMAGLERHERWEDTSEHPHVLIAEARGRGPEEPLPSRPDDPVESSLWMRLRVDLGLRFRRLTGGRLSRRKGNPTPNATPRSGPPY